MNEVYIEIWQGLINEVKASPGTKVLVREYDKTLGSFPDPDLVIRHDENGEKYFDREYEF